MSPLIWGQWRHNFLYVSWVSWDFFLFTPSPKGGWGCGGVGVWRGGPMRGLGSGHVTCGLMIGLEINFTGRGQTDTQTDRQTNRRTHRLYDWPGPEGRFSENSNTTCRQTLGLGLCCLEPPLMWNSYQLGILADSFNQAFWRRPSLSYKFGFKSCLYNFISALLLITQVTKHKILTIALHWKKRT